MMNQTLPGLHVRPGLLSDLSQVDAICADVWGGEDYIHYVWAEWVADPENLTFVLELDGQVAGLYCLRLGFAGPNSGWLQGVRVGTAFKRRGLAGFIFEQAIATSRAQGLAFVRYSTAQDNTPMHLLAERYGFRLVSNFLKYDYDSSRPVASGESVRAVLPSELEKAYELITSSAEYKASEGFYCADWHWRPLTREILNDHIEKGEVFSLKEPLEALAIAVKGEEETWLALLAGSAHSQQVLLNGLIAQSFGSTRGDQPVTLRTMLPQTALTENLLKLSGFVLPEHEPVMCLYQLEIEK